MKILRVIIQTSHSSSLILFIYRIHFIHLYNNQFMESYFIQWVTICTCHYSFWYPNCPSLARWSLSSWLLYLVDMSPSPFKYFLTLSSLGCSRFIITFSCSSYGMHHLFKESCFLCMTSLLETRRGGSCFISLTPNSGQSVDELQIKWWKDLKSSKFNKNWQKIWCVKLFQTPQYSSPVLFWNCSKSSFDYFPFSKFHQHTIF